jgi:hypothetical protein
VVCTRIKDDLLKTRGTPCTGRGLRRGLQQTCQTGFVFQAFYPVGLDIPFAAQPTGLHLRRFRVDPGQSGRRMKIQRLRALEMHAAELHFASKPVVMVPRQKVRQPARQPETFLVMGIQVVPGRG